MKDYTEELKESWESNDLTFVAKFTKSKDGSHGYFNNLTNPSTSKSLFYPEMHGLSIEDKRISFYWSKVEELVDKESYEIKLEFTDKPKGKNNPYSLKIKSVVAVDQSIIKIDNINTGKLDWSKILYFGEYHKKNEIFASFSNVMHSDNGTILLRNREPLDVFVDPKIELEENKYYSFSIKENGSNKLPSAISGTITQLKVNPYQDFIRLRFERLNNPEANKMIANLMREIGKGMYSSKQRMIFELLQNADDAPGKEKVEFHIDINGPYFFVMHDGAPFNKDDVEAITSAAESTKRGDNKKTGYKGIGFKSVFTDSTEVWINSGGYRFAFQRNNNLFDNFDDFYFSSERYKKYPEFVEEDKLKFRNQRLRFNGSTDIPWQVIPLWHDQLPSEFNNSNFNNFNNPVQFALNIGESNIAEYKIAIDNITKRPQFLLFLRNTSKFRAPKNGVTVLRRDIGETIEIIKSQKGVERDKVFFYKKQVFDNIAVSDEAFSNLNIGLRKASKINDYNEVTYYFIDLEEKEIETIPPKLASSFETEISFGVFTIKDKISAEREYLDGLPKYSSLFTYLPMEDTRFQLPFLVNADFVPSSDRQKIQGDNLWNKYIMIRAAEKHIDMLNNFANNFRQTEESYSTYLSLLLKNMIPDDDTAQSIIDGYNTTYLKQLDVKPIVVNDLNEIQLISDTIIDNSGLTELFGQEIFYEIINTQKKLPSSELDISYLINYKYLKVEQVKLEELALNLTSELCEQLGVVIGQNELYSDPKLLKWLNELVEYLPDLFGKIPFITHKNSLYSVEALLLEDDAWIINKNTATYEGLFKELGYHTINLELEKYTSINIFLLGITGYINDKALAYQRIESNSKLSSISIPAKITLLDFFRNAPFMQGIGVGKYYGELNLFVDENEISRPLNQLISREQTSDVVSIMRFRINETEYNGLDELLKKELIQKNTLFEKFVLNPELFDEWTSQFTDVNIEEYVNSLERIFAWIDEDVEISQSQWASIPWLYINNELRFGEAKDVYWSEGFGKIDVSNYNILLSIFTSSKLKKITLFECGRIISLFKLKIDNDRIEDWERIHELDKEKINQLLDWMVADGSYSDFFDNYTAIKLEGDSWSIVEIDKFVFDSLDTAFKAYIEELDSLNELFLGLDPQLCSENRHKLGLLGGGKLLKVIIETRQYNQSLAKHFSQKDNWGIFKAFVKNLPEFNLKTDEDYSLISSEHIILNTVLKDVENIEEIPEEIQEVLDNLLGKIKINSNPLSHYNLSDRIYFGKGDERKILKLSDVLKEFEGESDVLDKLIESFVGIQNKPRLRKLVFKTRQMSKIDICEKIETEESEFYSEYQIVFQLLYNLNGSHFAWKKIHFDTYLEQIGDKLSLYNSYKKFLDIVFEIQLTNLNGFYFLELEMENCVDKNWALDSEIIPNWLEQWVDLDTKKRVEFISKLGYNGIGSAIVKLRQEAIIENFQSVNVLHNYQAVKDNKCLSWNTIGWLSKYSSEIVTKNIELINLINNQVSNDDVNSKSLFIPIIENIKEKGERVYKLKNLSFENNLLVLDINQELSFEIYQILSKQDDDVLFVDENCGKQLKHFNTQTKVHLTTSVDEDELANNSVKWNEAFYNKWEYHNQYPIYLYQNGEIPYKQTFNDIIISSFTKDLKIENNGKYYISSLLSSDVLNNLPNTFPKDKLENLKEWHYKTLQNESLLDEDSFEYKEDIDRLLQDRLGLSSEAQKTESGSAKTHAVYFLKKEGFDVKNIIDAGASFNNIVDLDGNIVSCVVRSAKGGLLYLDKEHWDMLEHLATYLVVIYPGNLPRLFKDRMELLEEDLAHNILFRVPNRKSEKEIDSVLDTLKSNSHLILVTSEKMKEALFSKLKNTKANKFENDIAVTDDNFTFE